MSDATPKPRLREVVKNYTKARKFPQLIGTTPDGKRLFGGPYTYTQFIGAGVVAWVLYKTPGIWATGSMLRNGVVFLLITALTVYGLGRLPLGGRNPLSMVQGVGRALGSSTTAPKVNGRSSKPLRVRAFGGEVTILPAQVLSPAAELGSARSRVQAPAAVLPAAVAASAEKPRTRRMRSPRARPQPEPALQYVPVPAASVGVQRLVALAAASRPAREKA